MSLQLPINNQYLYNISTALYSNHFGFPQKETGKFPQVSQICFNIQVSWNLASKRSLEVPCVTVALCPESVMGVSVGSIWSESLVIDTGRSVWHKAPLPAPAHLSLSPDRTKHQFIDQCDGQSGRNRSNTQTSQNSKLKLLMQTNEFSSV